MIQLKGIGKSFKGSIPFKVYILGFLQDGVAGSISRQGAIFRVLRGAKNERAINIKGGF